MIQISIENKKRQIDNNLGIFTQALMWFIDGADTQEKLGMIKLMLCNLNCDDDGNERLKEKISPMIDTITTLIEDIRENKKTVEYINCQKQIFWHLLMQKEAEKNQENQKNQNQETAMKNISRAFGSASLRALLKMK